MSGLPEAVLWIPAVVLRQILLLASNVECQSYESKVWSGVTEGCFELLSLRPDPDAVEDIDWLSRLDGWPFPGPGLDIVLKGETGCQSQV